MVDARPIRFVSTIVVVVVLAGLAIGPAAAASATPTVSDAGVAPTAVDVAVQSDDCAPVSEGSPRSDPGGDELGWENGCWYDEPIAIDQSDGLDDPEIQALVSRTMARIERIRQLEFQRDVPVSIESRAEVRERFGNGSETNETFRTFDNAKFEALFLVSEANDSIAVQRRNTGAAVLGFYSHRSDEIVLVAENAEAAAVDEGTLAHELTHALQDQHFNLSRAELQRQTRDGVNAKDGLVEGDANYVQYRYMQQRCNDPDHAWNGTCVRRPGNGAGGGGLANIGVYFVKFQPYSDGPNFIQHVRDQGGWAAVNDLYADPPVSTEQVIHPEAYGDDQPADVTLEDTNTDAWTRVRPSGRPDYAEVGQAAIASMIVYPLYESGGQTRIVSPGTWLNQSGGSVSDFDPLNYGFDAAAGWDGDRLHVYRNGEGETAYVWRIVWDSAEDAQEFVDAYRQVLSYWGAQQVGENTYRIEDGGFADAFHLVVEGDTVTIVNAPSVEQLSAVRSGVETGTPTPTATATPTPDQSGDATETATPGDDETAASPTATETDTPGMTVVSAVLALAIALLALRGTLGRT